MGLRLGMPPSLDKDEPDQVTPWTVVPDELGNFYSAIFDQWVRNDVGQIFITNFEWAIFSSFSDDGPVCYLGKQCGNSCIVESNGDIYSCDHFVYPVPTILEATGISAPDTINGIKQRPIEGMSMVYTWEKANVDAPTRHTTQYFEMLGNRAIYHDGWMAATTPVTLPWKPSTETPPDVITGYKWELYNLKDDVTESNDPAAKMSDKLKELQDIFYAEAKKYDVFPLDNSTLARFLTSRPSPTAGRKVFEYSGVLTGVPPACAPSIMAKDYSIKTQVEVPKGSAEGMIVTQGGRFGGYGLFLSKGEFGFRRGKVVFLYNLLDLKRMVWDGPELDAGKHTIQFDFKYNGPGFGKGGTGVLYVDGKEVARKAVEHTTPIMFPEDEDFDIGMDTRTPVALLEYRYDCPFKFNGKINKLTFDLGPSQYTQADRRQLPEIADRIARLKD